MIRLRQPGQTTARLLGEGPMIDAIAAYENGELEPDRVIALFQRLVDTGLVWELQGHYGRTARALIEAGEVSGDNH